MTNGSDTSNILKKLTSIFTGKIEESKILDGIFLSSKVSELNLSELGRNVLDSLRQFERATIDYKNATLIRQLYPGDITQFKPAKNQMIAVKAFIVSPEGYIWTVRTRLSTGEVFTQERINKLLKSSLPHTIKGNIRRSDLIDFHIVAIDYYIESFTPR